MKAPPALGHPDRLGCSLCLPPPPQPTQGDDYGGVHSNSGVANKLCYLRADGDPFNGSTVTGLGIFLVAELFYEANANLLQPASDWTDLFNALTQAAINLGWTSPQPDNLYRACRAVEIAPPTGPYGDKHSTCPNSAGLPLCVLNFGPDLTVRQGVTTALARDALHVQSGNYKGQIKVRSHFSRWRCWRRCVRSCICRMPSRRRRGAMPLFAGQICPRSSGNDLKFKACGLKAWRRAVRVIG